MGLILSHDVGTGGVKAALVHPDGKLQSTVFEPTPVEYPQTNHAEQDPRLWWEAVCTASRRLMEQSGARPAEVLGMTFSYQMLGIVPMDDENHPLRPAIIWLDGRAGEQARQVMRMVGGPRIFASLFGVAITGKDVIPKLLWLKQHEADLYERTDCYLDVGGYLLLRATGRRVCEWSGASSSGLLNLKRKTWDRLLMRIFGLPGGKFPELVRATQQVGGLSKQAAAELGLQEGMPVIAGCGDAPAAAVGSGAVGENEGHICLGTSGWVGIITSRRVTGKRGIATIQSADPEKLFLIAETETAGACLEWAASELYGSQPAPQTFALMDADIASTDPGAGGLLFAPWMYGERCPVADECVRSAFINLSKTHERRHMTRAIYEGVAYNLRWMIDSLAEYYKLRPDPLRVIGGGAKGLKWLQIIADISGRRIESVFQPQHAAALGAALTAAVGMGVYPSFEAVKPHVPAERLFEPDFSSRQTYEELYRAYRQIYPCLRTLFHGLNRPA
jgi:xylulokinase